MKNEEHGAAGEGLLVLTELWELLRRYRASFVALGSLGLLAGLLLVARREPVYRAEVTMMLESDRSAGVLGDLAALTTAPQAVSEMEVLRSRTVAEAVVEGVGPRALPLTTRVESARLAPLAGLFGDADATAWEEFGEKPRLEAAVTGIAGEARQPVLIARFLGRDEVELSRRGALSAFGLGGAEARRYAFTPGEPLEYEGRTVRLWPEGDLSGEAFHLHVQTREEAVERLMLATRVAETQRNSGVLRLSLEDSDPERAAAAANALCEVYLERNRERQAKRASHTVEFIEEQLREQLAALEEAEREVVELQRASPRSVDVGATGEALIEQLSALQVEEVQLRMLLTALDEALGHLRSGDLRALSRLDAELADPVTSSYVAQIAQLTAEAQLLDRADAGVFKNVIRGKQLELEAEADALSVQLAGMEALVEALRGGDRSALGRLVLHERAGEQDPLLRSYVERWTAADARLRELRVEFRDELPEIRTLLAQLEGLEGRLLEFLEGRLTGHRTQLAEYRAILEGYEARVAGIPRDERAEIEGALERLRGLTQAHLTDRMAGLRSRLAGLGAEVESVEGSLAELPEELRVLADPLRRRAAHTETVKFLLGRQKEAEITRAASLASAEFIDRAVPPREPRGPVVPLFLAGGALAGLACALVLAFVRQSLDRTVLTTEELEEATALPLFGSIPDYRRGPCRVKGAPEGYLALRDDPEGPIAEAYRSLRSNLKFVLNTGQEGLELKTIAFTSCTQGEGKSVTNVDVALAFAMTGRRVLLVDADMRRPASNRYLGTPLTPGLSDVLAGRREWSECVQAGIAENLDLIPAGKQPASPGDLLAGAETGRFVAAVREAYDLVVFDVPPALAVADIDCLAVQLDAVLLITRAGKLSSKVVREGRRRLESVGAKLVGCVLNAARPTRGEQKYGYGYGYGYGERDAA
jgi:succinoglycan biosynthesis transport protein ExoP